MEHGGHSVPFFFFFLFFSIFFTVDELFHRLQWIFLRSVLWGHFPTNWAYRIDSMELAPPNQIKQINCTSIETFRPANRFEIGFPTKKPKLVTISISRNRRNDWERRRMLCKWYANESYLDDWECRALRSYKSGWSCAEARVHPTTTLNPCAPNRCVATGPNSLDCVVQNRPLSPTSTPASNWRNAALRKLQKTCHQNQHMLHFLFLYSLRFRHETPVLTINQLLSLWNLLSIFWSNEMSELKTVVSPSFISFISTSLSFSFSLFFFMFFFFIVVGCLLVSSLFFFQEETISLNMFSLLSFWDLNNFTIERKRPIFLFFLFTS